MQIMAAKQVTHECVNLNILTKIFSASTEDTVSGETFLQFTREIKHASCGSFTLFDQVSRRIIPGFIYDV